jgi:hypothetical protein
MVHIEKIDSPTKAKKTIELLTAIIILGAACTTALILSKHPALTTLTDAFFYIILPTWSLLLLGYSFLLISGNIIKISRNG